MADTATPTPVYKVTTFSEVQKDIANAESQQLETTEQNGSIPDASATTTNVQDSVQTDVQPQVQDQPVEENVSTIDLPFGEDVVAATTTTGDQPAATQPQTFNWKDEIKKVDRAELLKEVGLNDFTIELNDYLAKGGKATDYLNAKAVDYNTVPDEDIVKDDLRRQFPTFTKEEISRLFNRKYGTSDAMTEDEIQDASLQLKADAHTKRQNLISEQQKFQIPEAVIPNQPKDEAYEQWEEQQANQPAALERLSRYYNEHEATKTLNESKRVTINLGEGVAPLHFAVDKPEVITRVLTDDGTLWNKITSTEKGEPDVPNQQLITLFALNPQQFINGIFGYGLKMGEKKLVREGQNPSKPQAVIASISNTEKPSYRVGKFSGQ